MKNRKSSVYGFLAVLLVLICVIVVFSATGVFGFLTDTSSVVKNEFKVASVTCEAKSDYTVENTGNIPALIRVKLLVNWIDEDGNVLFPAPEDASYRLSLADSGWTHVGGTDPASGYWYCNQILSPQESSSVPLVRTVSASGGKLQIMMLAEAIQATPADAVRESWNMSFANGAWTDLSKE